MQIQYKLNKEEIVTMSDLKPGDTFESDGRLFLYLEPINDDEFSVFDLLDNTINNFIDVDVIKRNTKLTVE